MHLLHKSDMFPLEDPSNEIVPFIRRLWGGLKETLSKLYHTLCGPYDDTMQVPLILGLIQFSMDFSYTMRHVWGLS